MKEWLWLVFVAGVVLSWGCYVPTLHEGQKELGGGKPSQGSLRAFLCVGIAYFVTAVIVPLILLAIMPNLETGAFNSKGATVATFAGILGAVGALCIILAIKAGGKPVNIVPLVFAGAPIVSTFVAMAWHPPEKSPSPLFYAGILLAAIGAGLVLRFKPEDAKPQIKPTTAVNLSAPMSS